MRQRLTFISLLILGLHAGPASAFGIPALIGILLNAGTKAIESAEEARRAPPRSKADDERARKDREAELMAQLSREIDRVEAQPGLSPLQREWEIIRLEDHYGRLMPPPERDPPAPPPATGPDPSVVVARDVIGAVASTSNHPAVRILDVAVSAAATVSSRPAAAPSRNEVDITPPKSPQTAAPATAAPAEEDDFFAPDRGLLLHVEFVGSKTLTERLHASLIRRGHALTDKAMLADVVYRIEGEFRLEATAQHEGLTTNAGRYYEDPQSLPPLRAKPLLRSRRAAATTPSDGQRKSEDNAMYQAALIVAARQATGEKELRIVSLQEGEYAELRADDLIHDAIVDMMTKLGAGQSSPPLAERNRASPKQ